MAPVKAVLVLAVALVVSTPMLFTTNTVHLWCGFTRCQGACNACGAHSLYALGRGSGKKRILLSCLCVDIFRCREKTIWEFFKKKIYFFFEPTVKIFIYDVRSFSLSDWHPDIWYPFRVAIFFFHSFSLKIRTNTIIQFIISWFLSQKTVFQIAALRQCSLKRKTLIRNL